MTNSAITENPRGITMDLRDNTTVNSALNVCWPDTGLRTAPMPAADSTVVGGGSAVATVSDRLVPRATDSRARLTSGRRWGITGGLSAAAR